MTKLKIHVTKLNDFLLRLLKIVGFVSLAYLINLFVVESFGGVNPLIEFSSSELSKIESNETQIDADLGMAYQTCKDRLVSTASSYDFLDESYEAWHLSDGRFLIESRVLTSADSGAPVAANLLCRVLKTEDENLAVHWKVQGIQIGAL